jgi:hypothetical protein
MIWKTKKEGDRKIVKRFAFFPVELDDGNTIWLESFTREKVLRYAQLIYIPSYDGIKRSGGYFYWEIISDKKEK